ncbi:MAG TPA: DNA repair protein RadC [Firmicutes bacterium]|nr:DNA repair protein RadC [Bacillota bacterium]
MSGNSHSCWSLPGGDFVPRTRTRLKIKDLPLSERPREKLAELGEASLSNRELLAILLGTGTKEESALDLADRLLVVFSSLAGLMDASFDELRRVKGIGQAKAAVLRAAFVLAKRARIESKDCHQRVITGPQDVAELLVEMMSDLDKEYFYVVMLNSRRAVIGIRTVSIGSIDAVLVHPRELFKEPIKAGASAIILAHNHPSGDPTPSTEDLSLTRRLVQAGEILGIQIEDHIVIGGRKYCSLREEEALRSPKGAVENVW